MTLFRSASTRSPIYVPKKAFDADRDTGLAMVFSLSEKISNDELILSCRRYSILVETSRTRVSFFYL